MNHNIIQDVAHSTFQGLILTVHSFWPIETKYVSSCCLFGSGSGSRFSWKNTCSLIVKSMRTRITFSAYTRGFLPNLICEMKKEVLQHKSTYQKYILAIVIAGHTYTSLTIIHVMYWMALHVLNCIIWCTHCTLVHKEIVQRGAIKIVAGRIKNIVSGILRNVLTIGIKCNTNSNFAQTISKERLRNKNGITKVDSFQNNKKTYYRADLIV